jgi:predicted alternative tryptophan synthase beta-subunit
MLDEVLTSHRKKVHLERFSQIREQIMDIYRSWEAPAPVKVGARLTLLPLPNCASGCRGGQARFGELAHS